MIDIDFSGPLIRLDALVRQIYPAASDRQFTKAVILALEAQQEITRFLLLVVATKGKNEPR